MLTAKKGQHESPSRKRLEQNRGEVEAMDTSRDGSMSLGSDDRKSSCPREQEATSSHSPNSDAREPVRNDYYKMKSSYPHAMDTDSPSSYPKHVIVPSPPDSMQRQRKAHKTSASSSPRAASNVLTPVLTHEPASAAHVYDRIGYRPPGASIFYPSDGHYAAPGHFAPRDMDMVHPYGMAQNVQLHPKRWACDFCNVATFLTYEEACSHEERCASRRDPYGRNASFAPASSHMYNNGLGALFQASREVQHGGRWGAQPGPSPRIPSDRSGYTPRYQKFRMTGHEGRDGAAANLPDSSQKRMLLAMPRDSESLSDRQCFVRTDFVEVFSATEHDVASRHSKGAQKLVEGQVGIRCIHCAHLRAKDRAERAVCYPSSISRIYQTVADMQRFHFEQCPEIPDETRKIYKSLKTTRPRGEGSPQTYWIESAKRLKLVDSENGIRFDQSGKST